MAQWLALVSGGLSDINPTIVSTEIQLAAQAELPWPRIIDWRGYNGPGLTYNIPGAASLTMSAVTFTGSTTVATDVSAAHDTSVRAITISTKGVDQFINLDAMLSGVVDPKTFISDSMRKAFVKKVDTDVMGLYTESPTDVTGPLTYTAFLQAFEILAGQSAESPVFMVIPNTSIAAFAAIDEFKKANEFGAALLQQNIVMPAGYLGAAPFGVECYWSNHFTSSSGDHGMMFSKNAIRLVERLPFTISIDATQEMVETRAVKLGGTAVYGVAGQRGTSATTNPWVVDLVL
jgi:hypothetical protein